MKKIALLLVAAVFAIGIQSCSTDDTGIEEENLSKARGLNILVDPSEIRTVYVYYPPHLTEQDRLDYIAHFKENILLVTLEYKNDGCENVDVFHGVFRDGSPKPDPVRMTAESDQDNDEDPSIVDNIDFDSFNQKSSSEIINIFNFCEVINNIEGN